VAESGNSLRVSDAERDVTLKVLNEHAAVGRLSLDELEERSGKAMVAKTRGELAMLTSDLPADGGAPQPVRASGPRSDAQRKPVRWLIGIISGGHHRGRFRGVGTINAIRVISGDDIDLRDVELADGELRLNTYSLISGGDLYVPDGVEVDMGGFSLIGGDKVRGAERSSPGAPVIRIRAFSLIGGATIYRVPPQARDVPLSEARRLAKAAERGKLPPATT
jgi:Domain of unknown function (DUF1707)